MSIRLIRNALGSLLPNWAANLPGANTLYKLAYSIATIADVMLETQFEGSLAVMPGLGTPTAIPLLAQMRGLIQGRNESNAAFSARMLKFLNTWTQAGSEEILAQTLQAVLTANDGVTLPTVRVVTRNGICVTANPAGSVSKTTLAFAWDTVAGWVDGAGYHSAAQVAGWWSDAWILISPDPYVRYTSFTDANWLTAWANPNAGLYGIGHEVPSIDVSNTMATIAAFKGAHMFIRAVIWCADVTAFVPTGSDGNNSTNVGGVGTVSRDLSIRVWEPTAGG